MLKKNDIILVISNVCEELEVLVKEKKDAE